MLVNFIDPNISSMEEMEGSLMGPHWTVAARLQVMNIQWELNYPTDSPCSTLHHLLLELQQSSVPAGPL